MANELSHVQGWMEQAFYPVLLVLLMAGSLGLPVPEDFPLIAAGVLMRTTDGGVASWTGLFGVALVGIMAGDVVLYMLGRRWGPGAVSHRFTRWIVTPERFAGFSTRFCRHGTWFCFFGRFIMGVRAAMCVTAGATRFPLWRFFLADLAGALLSMPLFVLLGYWFAGMLDELQVVIGDAKIAVLVAALLVAGVIIVLYRRRRRRPPKPDRTGHAALPSADALPAEPHPRRSSALGARGVRSRLTPQPGLHSGE